MDNYSTRTGSSGRISYIDFLKFIGLTGIIIAHTGPPSWAFMLRNFDVPLVAILSSMLANRTFAKYSVGKTSVIDYMSRVKRFISSHSMWIYLWHILILDIYGRLKLLKIWFVKLILHQFNCLC